jgi:hypothetical protein
MQTARNAFRAKRSYPREIAGKSNSNASLPYVNHHLGGWRIFRLAEWVFFNWY